VRSSGCAARPLGGYFASNSAAVPRRLARRGAPNGLTCIRTINLDFLEQRIQLIASQLFRVRFNRRGDGFDRIPLLVDQARRFGAAQCARTISAAARPIDIAPRGSLAISALSNSLPSCDRGIFAALGDEAGFGVLTISSILAPRGGLPRGR